MRLRFEQSATAMLTYLPAASGGSPTWDPTSLTISVPGTNPVSGTTLPWSWGAIVLQDASTHPGTYTGPFASWRSFAASSVGCVTP